MGNEINRGVVGPWETDQRAGAAEVSPDSQPTRVLIAESDPQIRDILSRYLRRLAYRVSEVSDGEAAFEWFENQCCDLIIADLDLPGIDGLTLMAKIKVRLPDLPVVLISAGPPLEAEPLAGGGVSPAAAVLRKPFGLDQLQAAIDRIAPFGVAADN